MVASWGRSVAVCTEITAEAFTFGTFEAPVEVAVEVSGMIVGIEGSILARLFCGWVPDGVDSLIGSLSISRTNVQYGGMSGVLCIFLVVN